MRFKYLGSPSIAAQHICDAISIRVDKHLELPDVVQLYFMNLPKNTWAGVDYKDYTLVAISNELPNNGLPKILLHELIHVEQRHTGKLKISNDHWYQWCGIKFVQQDPEALSLEHYKNLPWEIDVQERLDLLIQKIFSKT